MAWSGLPKWVNRALGLHKHEYAPGGLSSIFDAFQYGARVDGSSDDSAAWQSAVDDAYSAGGGLVSCSKPGISIAKKIRLKNNVTLEIPQGLTLKLPANCSTGEHLVRNNDFTNGNSNISIVGEGVLDGNAANQLLGRNVTTIQMQKVTGLRVKPKKITGGIADGLYCYQCNGVDIDTDCSNNGLAGQDGSGCQLDTCSNVRARIKAVGNGFYGLLISSVTDSLIEIVAEGNSIDGARAIYSTDNTFIITSNSNAGRGLYLNSGSHRNTTFANIYLNSTNGLVVNNSNGNQIFVNAGGNTGKDVYFLGTADGNAAIGNYANFLDESSGANSARKIADLARISDLERLYPVGSIYINASVSTNPAELFGFGTWQPYGAGRVIVGLDASQAEFDALGEMGGSKEVTLTAAQSGLPAHTHTQASHHHGMGGASIPAFWNTGNRTLWQGSSLANYFVPLSQAPAINANAAADASSAHTNLQPYIVAYIWKRIA